MESATLENFVLFLGLRLSSLYLYLLSRIDLKFQLKRVSFHDFDFGMGGSSEGFVSLSSANLTLRDSDLEEELYMSPEKVWNRLLPKFKEISYQIKCDEECSMAETKLDSILYLFSSIKLNEDVFGTTQEEGRKEKRYRARYELR